jgi:hypothetical protein
MWAIVLGTHVANRTSIKGEHYNVEADQSLRLDGKKKRKVGQRANLA